MLRSVLADAVSSHMVSDVPIGAFLSGGIDSGVVVGLMAEASTRPVKTFSIGFDEPEFDELEAARRTARHFETDHHEFVVRPDALVDPRSADRSLRRAVRRPLRHSRPGTSASSRASHVKVALSGDGGDELFGGYDRYLPHPRVAAFDRWTGALGRHLAGAAWRLIPHGRRGRNFLRHVSQDRRGRFADSVAYFQPDEKTALFSPALRHSVDTSSAAAQLADRFDAFSGLDWRSQMMRVDFETYLPEDVLTKVDRMSMAHSLEARVPLLDHSVVQFASSLPSHMKIRHGERKHVFKRAASTVLPAEALTRKKKGFAVPIGAWLRGRLREAFVDTLQSTRARQRGYFDTAYIDRLITEHISGTREHTLRLWQLLVFELWHQRYLDHDATRQTSPARAPMFRTEVAAVP